MSNHHKGLDGAPCDSQLPRLRVIPLRIMRSNSSDVVHPKLDFLFKVALLRLMPSDSRCGVPIDKADLLHFEFRP
jgi:hypothetical protein